MDDPKKTWLEGDEPVLGSREAAKVLGSSHVAICRAIVGQSPEDRPRTRGAYESPWWPSEAALMDWWAEVRG
jgi:hypothetical protein